MEGTLVVHPTPYECESLSNYIFRLKEQNNCDIKWLDTLFEIPTQQTYDIYNSNDNLESMSLIGKATNLTIEKIKNMTIYRFDLWSTDQSINNCDNLLNHITPSSGNYFCPLCIKGNNYERIYWELDDIKICLIHNILLINQCTNCGKKITYKLFKNRTCSCGVKLANMLPTYINSESILMNQRRFYSWYNILKNTDDLSIKNLSLFSNSMYITFVSSLNKYVSKYAYYLKNKNFIKYYDDYVREFINIELTEKILSNWPVNFYKFMDLLNEYYIMNRSSKGGFSLYKQNPTPVMSMRKFKNVNMIYNELAAYFYLSYTYGFFYNMLEPILIYDKYIDISDTMDIFFIPEEYILKNFEVISIGKFNCISLLKIIEFFKNFIKQDNLIKHEGQADLLMIYNTFSSLGISLTDIFAIVYANHIEITIDIFNCGISMLCVSQKEVEDYITAYLG